MTTDHRPTVGPVRAWSYLAILCVGYVGIYLCRKNFSVAIPMIREEFGISKEQIGIIVSASTLAYMVGKFAFGPLIDRMGGRASFLAALVLVCLFGACGGLVGSMPALAVVYSLNRLAGSAGWGSMVKMVPEWFVTARLPLAMAVLSLSFVFGGVLAVLLAGVIGDWSGNSWRWVMSGPAAVLGVIVAVLWFALPRKEKTPVVTGGEATAKETEGFAWARALELIWIRQFWVVCALSFTLTLLRETFNTWAVDFFRTTGGAEVSGRIAAFLSTPFDALGAVGIVLLGWMFGRLTPTARKRSLVVILLALGVLVALLPIVARQNLALGAVVLAGIGFLAYGPYSLLAGILSLEIRGKAYVATVAGMVDGSGYLAAVLAGAQFGRLLDIGGYDLGFTCLAGLAGIAAILCLGLYGRAPAGEAGGAPAATA